MVQPANANRSLGNRWVGTTEFEIQHTDTVAAVPITAPSSPDCDGGDSGPVGPALFPIPATWHGIQRVLIEYCTYDESALCKPTRHSKGCYNIRCTKEHDMTSRLSIADICRSSTRQCCNRTLEWNSLHGGFTVAKLQQAQTGARPTDGGALQVME